MIQAPFRMAGQNAPVFEERAAVLKAPNNQKNNVAPYANFSAQRLADMRAKYPNQKIAVLIGDSHTVLSNQMFSLAFLQALLKKGIQPIWGHEIQHNYIQSVSMRDGFRFTSETLREKDPLGQNAARVILHSSGSPEAPLCRRARWLFTLKHNIPCSFNDASYIASREQPQNVYLNMQDSQTTAALRDLDHDLSDDILADQSIGMSARNLVIARNMQKQYDSQNGDLIVQSVGRTHVFGSTARNCDYKTSLSSFLRQQGWLVFCIVPASLNVVQQSLPSKASVHDTVFVDGLDRKGILNPRGGEEYRALIKEEYEYLMEITRVSEGFVEPDIIRATLRPPGKQEAVNFFATTHAQQMRISHPTDTAIALAL